MYADAVLTVFSASTGMCRAVGNLPLPNAALLLVSTTTKTGEDEPAREFLRDATTASAGTQNEEATSVPVSHNEWVIRQAIVAVGGGGGKGARLRGRGRGAGPEEM